MAMNKPKLLFAGGAMALALLLGCATRPAPSEAEGIRGMISRIEHGGNVAYIFGSAHLGRPGWFPLDPIVEDAMARADVFAFEIDLLEMASPAVLERTMELMMLPEGKTLEDVLPADVFQNFIENLATFPVVTYEMIAQFTPVAALTVIVQAELMPLLGAHFDYSVDLYVVRFALNNGRPIIGLNDTFQELELMFDVPLEIQSYALDDFLDWQSSIEAMSEFQLIEAYEAQDIDMLRHVMSLAFEQEDNPFVQYSRHINFYHRCHIFADEIARLLRETQEPTIFFVTVGIGHLLGDGGGKVFELLADMGFDVAPLEP